MIHEYQAVRVLRAGGPAGLPDDELPHTAVSSRSHKHGRWVTAQLA